jgi:hypothetical protein
MQNGSAIPSTEAAMPSQRILSALTIANLALLLVVLAERVRPAMAQDEQLPVLRGRGLEIVDAQGRVRASISVLPASQSQAGGGSSETVLLRLITERGRPTVKIGSSEPQSGLSFAGPTGTQDTYVILEARGTSTSMKLRAEGGREQVLKP